MFFLAPNRRKILAFTFFATNDDESLRGITPLCVGSPTPVLKVQKRIDLKTYNP